MLGLEKGRDYANPHELAKVGSLSVCPSQWNDTRPLFNVTEHTEFPSRRFPATMWCHWRVWEPGADRWLTGRGWAAVGSPRFRKP